MSILYDVITESKNKYLTMFEPFQDILLIDTITPIINNVKNILKREDRIVWFLRYYRMGLINDYIKNPDISEENREKLNNWLLKEINKVSMKLSSQKSDIIDEVEIHYNRTTLLSALRHFISMEDKIPTIKNYVFSYQLPSTIIKDFSDIEAEWIESRKEIGLEPEEHHTIVLKFKDGSAWWNLNQSSCSDEADQMGHCGNSGGYGDQTILSYRQYMGDNLWSPKLTFIYHENSGSLGEMKGRANEKPTEKYHPYIIELLKLPMIKRLAGRGYLPHNNFSFNDLSESEQEEVINANPNLMPIGRKLKENNFSSESVNEVVDLLSDRFNSIELYEYAGIHTTLKEHVGSRVEYIFEQLFGRHSTMYYVYGVVEGEHFVDMYYDTHYYDESLNDKLNEKQIEAILLYYDETKNFQEEIDNGEYQDVFEYLFNSESTKEILSDLRTAMRIAYEYGLESEYYRLYTENLKNIELPNSTVELKWNPDYTHLYLIVDLKSAIQIYEEYTTNENGDDFDSLFDLASGRDINIDDVYAEPDMDVFYEYLEIPVDIKDLK